MVKLRDLAGNTEEEDSSFVSADLAVTFTTFRICLIGCSVRPDLHIFSWPCAGLVENHIHDGTWSLLLCGTDLSYSWQRVSFDTVEQSQNGLLFLSHFLLHHHYIWGSLLCAVCILLLTSPTLFQFMWSTCFHNNVCLVVGKRETELVCGFTFSLQVPYTSPKFKFTSFQLIIIPVFSHHMKALCF